MGYLFDGVWIDMIMLLGINLSFFYLELQYLVFDICIIVFFKWNGYNRELHSYPTRHSFDNDQSLRFASHRVITTDF